MIDKAHEEIKPHFKVWQFHFVLITFYHSHMWLHLKKK